jgi:hypothetical protein
MRNSLLVLVILVLVGCEARSSTHPPGESRGGPMVRGESQNDYVVSVTFGKSFSYSPVSNEAFHWDGSLRVERGELIWIDKLLYVRTDWARGWMRPGICPPVGDT